METIPLNWSSHANNFCRRMVPMVKNGYARTADVFCLFCKNADSTQAVTLSVSNGASNTEINGRLVPLFCTEYNNFIKS